MILFIEGPPAGDACGRDCCVNSPEYILWQQEVTDARKGERIYAVTWLDGHAGELPSMK